MGPRNGLPSSGWGKASSGSRFCSPPFAATFNRSRRRRRHWSRRTRRRTPLIAVEGEEGVVELDRVLWIDGIARFRPPQERRIFSIVMGMSRSAVDQACHSRRAKREGTLNGFGVAPV
jgi:hypothetical protein